MLAWQGGAARRQSSLLAALMVLFHWWTPSCEYCSGQREDVGKIGCLRVVLSAWGRIRVSDYQSDCGELLGYRDVGHMSFPC